MNFVGLTLPHKAPQIALASLFAVFVVTLPRYTDLAKIWFALLILTALGYLLLNPRELLRTTAGERLYFGAMIVNFAWMAFTFYYNGQPELGAGFLWDRHFYFLFVIPLYVIFRRVGIGDGVLLVALTASAVLTFGDMLADLLRGIDHREQGMNPNSLGPIQLSIAGILLFLLLAEPVRWRRLLASAGFVLAMATVVLSQSRGTWMIVPVLILFFGFYLDWTPSLRKRAAAMLALLLLVASSYFVPFIQARIDQSLANVEAYFQSEDFRDDSRIGTFGTRIELWKTGWMIFLEQPLTGAGLGGFREKARDNWQRYEVNPQVQDYKYVHNQYLAALASRGLPGLLLYLLVLGLPAWLAWRHAPQSRTGEMARRCLLLLFLVYAIDGLVEDPFEGKSTTMFVGTLLPLFLARLNLDRRPNDDGSTAT